MSKYIIANFDRREFLRPEVFGEEADLRSVVMSHQGVLTALTVLLADGNGRGGGDLGSDAPIIGTWAGSRIAIIDESVTHKDFSEPGMDQVPLQQQMLAVGKDVSREVFDVIKVAEGGYWACSALNAKHTLPLPVQRGLPDAGATYLLSAEGRRKPLQELHELFGIFGVAMGITPAGAVRQLQKGLDKMAPAFGLQNDFEVIEASFKHGKKPMTVSDYSGDKTPSNGIVAVQFKLRNRATGEDKLFDVRLGAKGSTAADLYQSLFPNIQFEKAPAITDGVRSPEVVKLLANLKLDQSGDNASKEA